MSTGSFDLIGTYINLRADGGVQRIEIGPTFWPDVMAGKHPELEEGRLVAVFPYDGNWTSAEMHPAGDELVYVLSGAVDLILQEPGGDRAIPLEAGEGQVVPKGVWHTARVRARAKVLHVTAGAGTQHRPL